MIDREDIAREITSIVVRAVKDKEKGHLKIADWHIKEVEIATFDILDEIYDILYLAGADRKILKLIDDRQNVENKEGKR